MCLALKLDSIRNEIVGNSINRYYFDDTIYHYTSPGGLEGILLEKGYPVFHFSRFDCLNDKSEGKEIIQLYRHMLDRESSNPIISKEYLALISDLLPTDNVFFSIDMDRYGFFRRREIANNLCLELFGRNILVFLLEGSR